MDHFKEHSLTSSKWNTRSSSQTFSKVLSKDSTNTYTVVDLFINIRSVGGDGMTQSDVLVSDPEYQVHSLPHPPRTRNIELHSYDTRLSTCLPPDLSVQERLLSLEHRESCITLQVLKSPERISFLSMLERNDVQESKTLLDERHRMY